MKEIWKEIKEYPNYKISNTGKVYSCYYKRILKPSKDRYGYYMVSLTKDKIHKSYLVHRLVAQTFLENPNNLSTVNHKDKNKENNRVDNLEYMSRIDNCRYSFCKKVYQYDLEYNLIKVWDSVMDIERTLGFNNSSICSCCNNRRKHKTAYKYIWSYTPLN